MSFQPLHLLIELLVAVFLIRFHANAYRLGRNPILEKLNQLTNPVVLPFNRLIPTRRWDIGALLAALVIALLAAFLLTRSLPLTLILGTLQHFLGTWLDLILYSLIIVVIGSWLQADPRQPVMQLMLACNEWIMAPLRRIIPSFGGLDFSPIIVLFAVQFGKYALGQLTVKLALATFGHP